MAKLPFSELVTKIQTGVITHRETEECFGFDSTRSEPFAPHFVINENAVDLRHVEDAAREGAHELAIAASRVAQINHLKTLKGVPVPDGSIIAAGDSWFHLPSWYQKTMIDWLQDDYPITNIAHEGDTLEDTMAKYLPYINPKVRILMVSSGGDDILGDMSTCLNLFDPDHTDPKQASYYLSQGFYDVLANVDTLYRRLAYQVHSLSPNTKIIVHGYDLISPWCHGLLIGNNMAPMGLDACWSPGLCEAIIHLMINRFNDMLANLASFLPNFAYVNLRGTLHITTNPKNTDIFDELHPKSDKAKLLAKKMAKYLGKPPKVLEVKEAASRESVNA